MQLRISRVRRGDKTYEYAQLVQSYRRKKDGMPMHRVVASLGRLTPDEVANLKLALQASRKGRRVVLSGLPERTGRAGDPIPKPQDNLRYLDVAVLLELWRRWGLGELIDELLPAGGFAVPVSSVVAALTLQRCVDPGSKLYAQRWFPRTALPELLGVAPASFNNTRLHRALDDLDRITPALMGRLARRQADRQGAFASLFIDVTDTWFAGEGPALAETGRTKEGRTLKKIGIVLLCNEHGWPLRWKTLPGARSDGAAMADMLREVAGLSWAGEAPVVCDRAMGATAQIRQLLGTGLRFLTALTRNEFGSYTDAIPHQAVAGLRPTGGDVRQQAADAGRQVEAAGMTRVADDLFVLDLSVIERPEGDGGDATDDPPTEIDSRVHALRMGMAIRQAVRDGRADSNRAAGRALGLDAGATTQGVQLLRLPEDVRDSILSGGAGPASLNDLATIARMRGAGRQRQAFERLVSQEDRTVRAMRLGRAIRDAIDSGAASSVTGAGELLGLKHGVTFKFVKLCRLPEDVERAVLAGRAAGLRVNDLLDVSELKRADSQRRKFDRLVGEAVLRGRAQPGATVRRDPAADDDARPPPVRVRAVAFFNPDMFVAKRARARDRLDDIEAFVEELNARLARPASRRTPAQIAAVVDRKLRRHKLLDAFDVQVEDQQVSGRIRHRVRLTLNEADWARRRRYDGFCLLVGHPDLDQSGADLCRLYRAKDQVEKDFEVIKGVVRLRPVRHRTDAKVRAHVTLCMLALLLERTLRWELRDSHTSQAALEILADRHLNRYATGDGGSAYTLTQTTTAHDKILRALQLQHLADDREIADRIVPR